MYFWKYSAIGYTDQVDKRVLLRYDKNTLNITLILLKWQMLNKSITIPLPQQEYPPKTCRRTIDTGITLERLVKTLKGNNQLSHQDFQIQYLHRQTSYFRLYPAFLFNKQSWTL